MKAKKAAKPAAPPEPERTAASVPGAAYAGRFPFLFATALALSGLAVYARTLSGPFLFDDADLLEAPAVRSGDWRVILTGPRPLTILSFSLNHAVAGFDPFYFHLISVALHLINALILWGVVRRLCDLPAVAGRFSPEGRGLLAWAIPLLFLLTPVHTESVSYISSRSELLKAGPYLAAMLVFLSSWRQKRPWLAAFLVTLFYGCSVAGKEDGLTLPVALVLLDYLLVSERDWRQMLRNWPVYAMLAAMMLLGAWIKVRPLLDAPSAGFFLREVTWKDYLFTQFRMYFLYLRLLLVPFGLTADYDIPPSRSLFEHGSGLALAGLLLLTGAAVWRRRRRPLFAFGVLFFVLALLPTSSFYPLLDYAAERRLYLPSAGFFLAALSLAAERWGARRQLVAALGALAVIYAAGTYARNGVWRDSLALWQDTAAKSPNKWRVFTWLGREYSERQRFEEATQAYQRAADLVRPRSRDRAEVLSSLGSTYANRRMYAEAIQVYEEALQMEPAHSRLWTNLAIAKIRLNRPEGWEHFERAIVLDPVAWEPHLARGNLLYQMGRYDDAIQDYERVLDLLPNHPDALHNLKAARAMKQLQR
jgi:tetratricopeptide (TPR) repeat protein